MSIECVRAVLESSQRKGNARLLMLTIAEHADTEGGTAFPGNALLARETNMSERQIQRLIATLAEAGEIEILQDGNGRGNKRMIRINVGRYKKDDISSAKGDIVMSPFNKEKRVTFLQKKGDKSSIKGDIFGIKGDIAMSPEPLTIEPTTEPMVRAHTNGFESPPPPPPPKRRNTHEYIDPRKIVNDFVPKGKGDTPYEVFREFYPWIPNLSQIKHMHENVTDLAKWREVLQECAIRGFKTYKNMFDVYANGWRSNQYTDRPPPAPVKIEHSIAGML